ncbi:MAG: YbaB/EbfC family nucleoid-associated protein [Verrucomicrobiota bacterium]|nr:YbaB/EbfC family nucleoid-associated protein [Verrucomicrobiota bacterium]
MGSGFSKMKKQARMMQSQVAQMREQMAGATFEGSAGGGLVALTLNGEKELKKITIKPECLTDVEGLQDLIIAAFEDASKKIEKNPSPLPFFQ